MTEPWSWCEGNSCPVVVAFCYSIEERTCGPLASVGSWSCKRRNRWHALSVCVVLNSIIWLASSQGHPTRTLQWIRRICWFAVLTSVRVSVASSLLRVSYQWTVSFIFLKEPLVYSLNCVPTTGVFVRYVAVNNTNLAAVRTSEVRMTAVYFIWGSTEVGAGVPCRRADSDWICVWLEGIQQLAASLVLLHRPSSSEWQKTDNGDQVYGGCLEVILFFQQENRVSSH